MSHENFLSHRIKCDYPDCGKPCDDWWNDQWLTLVKYGVHGRMVSVRHFCTSHLDTMRNPIPAGSYHLPDNTPKDWHTWGEGYMYPIYEPCIPTILNVLEKATPDNHSPTNLSKNARSHYSERIRTGLKTIRRNMKYSTCGNSRCLAFRNSF